MESREDFKHWFDTACGVYCTLVDRIVPGYPRDTIGQILDRIGLDDKLVVKGEIFIYGLSKLENE